jgi:hypothetical protein
MSLDELKLVLEMVQGVTGTAQNIAAWYLAYKLAGTLLGYVALGAFMFMVWKIAIAIIAATQAGNEAATAMLQIRRHLGLMAYPYAQLDVSVCGLVSSHCQEAVRAVAELVRKP